MALKSFYLLALCLCASVVQFAPAGVRFDGVDDKIYCDAGNCQNLNFTNQISLSVWYVRAAGLTSGAELISKGRLFNGNVAHFHLRDNGGKVEFYFSAPAGTFHIWSSTAATFTATNVPYHVAWTYQWGDSNSATLFVNGARQAGVWTAGASNTIGLTNAEPLEIGFGAALFWRGQIFEPAIWNGILTWPEIYSLATARIRGQPLQIQPANLKFYSPLEDKFPAWSTMSGSNAIVDLSKYRVPLTPQNSPVQHPMLWLSPMR